MAYPIGHIRRMLSAGSGRPPGARPTERRPSGARARRARPAAGSLRMEPRAVPRGLARARPQASRGRTAWAARPRSARGASSTERRPNGACARDRRRAVRPAASGRPLQTSRGPRGPRRPHGSHGPRGQPPGCLVRSRAVQTSDLARAARTAAARARRAGRSQAAVRMVVGNGAVRLSERMGRRARGLLTLIGSAVRAGRSAARWRPLLRGCPNHVFIV